MFWRADQQEKVLFIFLLQNAKFPRESKYSLNTTLQHIQEYGIGESHEGLSQGSGNSCSLCLRQPDLLDILTVTADLGTTPATAWPVKLLGLYREWRYVPGIQLECGGLQRGLLG